MARTDHTTPGAGDRRPRRPDASLRRRRFRIAILIGAALLSLIALDRAGLLLVPSGDEPVDVSAEPQPLESE